jgi:hypothetical protein
MMQLFFDFYANLKQDRWRMHLAYLARHPDVGPLLIAILRKDTVCFGRCSMQRAIETLRVEYGLRIGHSERACFAREIKSIYPDLARYIRTRFCMLDMSRRPLDGV